MTHRYPVTNLWRVPYPGIRAYLENRLRASIPVRRKLNARIQQRFQTDGVRRFRYPHYDVSFNIDGNRYRLVTVIYYNRRKVFIRSVLTPVEYDRGNWKHKK